MNARHSCPPIAIWLRDDADALTKRVLADLFAIYPQKTAKNRRLAH